MLSKFISKARKCFSPKANAVIHGVILAYVIYLIKETLSLRSVNHERLSFYEYIFITTANSKFFQQKFTLS